MRNEKSFSLIPNSAFLIPNCFPASLAALELARGIFIVVVALLFTELIVERTGIIFLFGALLIRIFIENRREKIFQRLASTVRASIRKKIHAAVFNHDQKKIANGELLTLLFDTVAAVDRFIVGVLPIVASIIILTPLILIVAAFIDPLSALIFFVTLPIAPFLLYLIGRAIGDRNAKAQALLIKLNADFDELIRAVPTLKMFRQTAPAVERLRATSEKSSAAILDVLRLAFVSAFALELITTLAIALVAVTCGLRLTAGAIEFRAAFFILMLAPEFFAPIRRLGAAFHSFVDARQALERLKPFLAVEKIPRGAVVQTQIPPSITVKNLSFTYENKLTPTLEGINLSIEAGKITVIKGESGAGKSTLLKLIAGLNRPTVGEIFINDLPMSKVDRRSLIEKIAYVPQQPHHFITPVDGIFNGEAHTLSRGQLQRLGLSRALSKIERGASIIVLDEPTAGLDLETEAAIIEVIKKIARRRTVVIAAHRPAVIDIADKVIDLDR